MSYVRLIISYVRLIISYVRDNKSYVRHNKSYIRLIKSYVRDNFFSHVAALRFRTNSLLRHPQFYTTGKYI